MTIQTLFLVDNGKNIAPWVVWYGIIHNLPMLNNQNIFRSLGFISSGIELTLTSTKLAESPLYNSSSNTIYNYFSVYGFNNETNIDIINKSFSKAPIPSSDNTYDNSIYYANNLIPKDLDKFYIIGSMEINCEMSKNYENIYNTINGDKYKFEICKSNDCRINDYATCENVKRRRNVILDKS